ncbi:hypothetical protein AGMMS49992_09350 [Clostridia bacterium]|nr:hypothetical protein AGMMS49992_09350 [Clostridia bacterium]
MSKSRTGLSTPPPPLPDTTRAFLALLEAAIHAHAPLPLPDGVDWRVLYRLALEHRVDGLLLAPVLQLPTQPPPDMLIEWQRRAMATTMQQLQIVDSLHTALTAFEDAGIRAVVLKGIILKALYPEPDLRVMSDADLLVEIATFDSAKELLLSQGFEEIKDDSHEDTFVCANPDGLRVELHNRLFDRKQQGFLSRLDEGALFPVTIAVRAEAYGGECLAFPPSEHALFQLAHMAKHMIVTGFGLRQVCDFCLFVEAYDSTINWLWFIQQCKELGLTEFLRALLALCRDYLGLKSGMWQDVVVGKTDAANPGRILLDDLLDAGVFGKSTAERTRSAAVIYRSFDSESGNDSKLRRLTRAVFIRRDELHPPYMYAKRHAFLLPAAWAHRLFRYIFVERRRGGEIGAGLGIADERLALLKQLDMLK